MSGLKIEYEREGIEVGVVLKATGLSYYQGKSSEAILQNINLAVATGELCWIQGGSGVGKSCLINLLAGLLEPSEGAIERNGLLAWMPQKYLVYQDLTVAENLEFYCRINDYQDSWQVLLTLGGLELRQHQKASELPAGYRKMLQFCIALTRNADLFMLDEPAAGMDEQQTGVLTRMLQMLKTSGKAIVVTASDNAAAVVAADLSYQLVGGMLVAKRYQPLESGVMEGTR